jgi:hypothetical protein
LNQNKKAKKVQVINNLFLLLTEENSEKERKKAKKGLSGRFTPLEVIGWTS